MSYAEPVQPSPPGAPPARPTVVTVSTWLLWLTAALYLVGVVATALNISTITEVARDAYAGTEFEGQEGGTIAGYWGSVVVGVLLAIAFLVLGFFNNRGKNPSRITTWVIGGLAVCCTGVLLVINGVLTNMEVEGGPDPAELQRRLSDELPSWFNVAEWGSTIGSILALIVALILLALPASNEFFRKPPEEIFEPPPSYPSPPAPPPASS